MKSRKCETYPIHGANIEAEMLSRRILVPNSLVDRHLFISHSSWNIILLHSARRLLKLVLARWGPMVTINLWRDKLRWQFIRGRVDAVDDGRLFASRDFYIALPVTCPSRVRVTISSIGMSDQNSLLLTFKIGWYMIIPLWNQATSSRNTFCHHYTTVIPKPTFALQTWFCFHWPAPRITPLGYQQK